MAALDVPLIDVSSRSLMPQPGAEACRALMATSLAKVGESLAFGLGVKRLTGDGRADQFGEPRVRASRHAKLRLLAFACLEQPTDAPVALFAAGEAAGAAVGEAAAEAAGRIVEGEADSRAFVRRRAGQLRCQRLPGSPAATSRLLSRATGPRRKQGSSWSGRADGEVVAAQPGAQPVAGGTIGVS
jgi:hypothetical protein